MFQIPIRDFVTLTGLNLAQLEAADRMPMASTLGTAKAGTTWRELVFMECFDLNA